MAASASFGSMLAEFSSGFRVPGNILNFQLLDLNAFFLLFANLLLHSVGSKVWLPSFIEMGLLYKCKRAKIMVIFFVKRRRPLFRNISH